MKITGKNGISANVICASVSPAGKKLTTLELTYPRFILAELNTHRMLSKNSSSSRAIPIAKMIEQVRENPAIPIHWGLNQSGMQAKEEQADRANSKAWWLRARDYAVIFADSGIDMGIHKQHVNRLLEPFLMMKTIVSATEFENFFAQRISPDAQPEICELATVMKQAMDEAEYIENAWHLPYTTDDETEKLSLDDLRKVSVSRCCRVSYSKHGIESSIEDDILRHDDLLKYGHWSPFEHVACALNNSKIRSGNFIGFHQYRQIVQGISATISRNIDYLKYI